MTEKQWPKIVDAETGEVVTDEPKSQQPPGWYDDGYRPKGRGVVTSYYDDPLERLDADIREDAQKFLTPTEIRENGGFRWDGKKSWWMNARQLIEYTKLDLQTPSTPEGDRAFWAWFREYRVAQNLGKTRGNVSWREKFGSAYQGVSNYMSHWWSQGGYGSYGSYSAAGNDKVRKLAVALGAIKTTVSVINDTTTPYRVELDDGENGPVNYTNFDDRRIVVSPEALLNEEIKQEDAIEITTGYGLHEASHVQYTEPIVGCLKEPTPLLPLTVTQRLLNIIDDIRIEGLTGRKYPGFAPYFEKMLKHLWGIQEGKFPKAWGPELGDKMNALLGFVRWPAEYEPTARADPKMSEEFDWWNAWVKRYLDEETDARMALVEALNHLKEDPETEQQLNDLAEQEEQMAGGSLGGPMTEEQFRKLIEQLKEALEKGQVIIESCPNHQRDGATLTDEQSKEISDLLGQGLEIKDPIVTMKDLYGNQGGPEIMFLHPELDLDAKQAYRKPTNLVARMRNAFFFRKAAPRWSDRLLRSGTVDDEEVWRFGAGDYRIFEKQITVAQPDVQVTMLVDMSGSMSGDRIASAFELANVMLECLKTMNGVRVRVRGHTTPYEERSGGTSVIYRIWETGEPVERLGLIDTQHHGWNYDGFAIDAVAQEMLAHSRPNENMVMFVLSDGKPNARGFPYSGLPAMQHVRKVTDHYERQGITIIQIAIDPEMRSHDQATMYKNWIPFTEREKLPGQLTREMTRLLGGAQ